METEIIKAISLSYEEGRFFDLWMIVHLLAGVFAGFLALDIKITKIKSYVIGILAFIAWELFELFVNIKEAGINQVIDVFIATLGMTAVFALMEGRETKYLSKILLVVTIIFLTLSAIGWMAAIERSMVI